MWESFKCECGREYAVNQGSDPIENPACVECGSDNSTLIENDLIPLVDKSDSYELGD